MHCPYCSSPIEANDASCGQCGANLAGFALPKDTPLQDGKYVLGQVLGQGGFGITYQANSSRLGVLVAIKEFFPTGATRRAGKVLAPAGFASPGFVEARDAFLTEARTLARISHAGVVRVYDAFLENDTAYLVMELLNGATLEEHLLHHGPLLPDDARTLALELAQALQAVHQAGLLHRDIKPGNVMLTRLGRAVLIDFGSARAFETTRTVQHTRLVTPGYAPLEQYATSAKFGPYTDIYALAATLVHALTGVQPPSATDRTMGASLPALPKLAPGLRQALERGLELKVQDRPQTMQEWLALVQATPKPAAKTVAKTVIVEPQTGPRSSSANATPTSTTYTNTTYTNTTHERVLFRSPDGSLLLTSLFVTRFGETVPLRRYRNVALTQSVAGGGVGGGGCLVLVLAFLALGIPVLWVPVVLLLVGGMFSGRRRVYHLELQNAFERLRVASNLNRADLEALAEEIKKCL